MTFVQATLDEAGVAILTIDAEQMRVEGQDVQDTRDKVRQVLAEIAANDQADVVANIADPDGVWNIVVTPGGKVIATSQAEPDDLAPPDPTDLSVELPRPTFVSFEEPAPPPTSWLRSLLHLSPSPRQLAAAERDAAISQHWTGPRTVAVINPKGGSGKTPTTIGLSAAIARNGGNGVVAWDWSQSSGTLPWRTALGAHQETVTGVIQTLSHSPSRLDQMADWDAWLTHQPDDKFAVLAGPELAASRKRRLTADELIEAHTAVQRIARLIVADTANDPSDPIWTTIIDLADIVIVPTTLRDDHQEAAAVAIDALPDRLAPRRVVLVVTDAAPNSPKGAAARVAANLAPMVRSTFVVPYDPHLVDGQVRWQNLSTRTRDAFSDLAAATVRLLSTDPTADRA